jgi:hypothetical protein
MGHVTSSAEVRHFRAVSWGWLRRPRTALRLVVPAPTWPDAFAVLGHLWRGSVPSENRPQPAEPTPDQDAWRLLWTGAKHFGATVDHHGDINPKMMHDAAEVLRGAEKARELREALRSVEAMLAGSRDCGASFEGFERGARALCHRFGRPDTDARELAEMLAHSVKPTRSGRLKSGTVSESRIANWLVQGGPWGEKLAATLARGKK